MFACIYYYNVSKCYSKLVQYKGELIYCYHSLILIGYILAQSDQLKHHHLIYKKKIINQANQEITVISKLLRLG